MHANIYIGITTVYNNIYIGITIVYNNVYIEIRTAYNNIHWNMVFRIVSLEILRYTKG